MNLIELTHILKYRFFEYYGIASEYVLTHKKETLLVLFVLWLFVRLYDRRKRRLKKKKYRNKKLAESNKFYGTGFRCELCLWDVVKFKVRLADYCDKKGVRYNYLFNIKLFKWESLRTKVTDHNGFVTKRRITFRS